MGTQNKILDSWALIAYFEAEPGGTQVASLLKESLHERASLMITTINLGEVWYTVARRYGEGKAAETVEKVKSLGIQIVPVAWSLAYQAARFKVGGGLAFADCFAAALAFLENVPLVTGDPEFSRLEGEIDIIWLSNE